MIVDFVPLQLRAAFDYYSRVVDLATFVAGISLPVSPVHNRHKVWFAWHGGSSVTLRCRLRFSLNKTTLFELPIYRTNNYSSSVPELRLQRMAGISGSESVANDYTEGFVCKPPASISGSHPVIMHMFQGVIDKVEIISETGTNFTNNMVVSLMLFSDCKI